METFRRNIFKLLLGHWRTVCSTAPATFKPLNSRWTEGNRPKGGNRPLTDPAKLFAFNNWDNVVWDEEQEEEAKKITEAHANSPLPPHRKVEYDEKADEFWDDFYKQHKNRFFKDRHWLFTEFPELDTNSPTSNDATTAKHLSNEEPCLGSLHLEDVVKHSDCAEEHEKLIPQRNDLNEQTATAVPRDVLTDVTGKCDREQLHSCDNFQEEHEAFPGDTSSFRILEVGCGVGNTVFPVLQTNNDPGLMVYCCDFSTTAIELVKSHPDYDTNRCHAFVFDVADDKLSFPFPDNSLDLVILIFVLSSINPERACYVIDRLCRSLKPGGKILFRDYGRYDLAQLRFKKDRCLSENFYVRGDGTRVYFFTQDELKDMFEKSGMIEIENVIDRRLQVNRGKQLKMYRVWIQCKYKKPLS